MASPVSGAGAWVLAAAVLPTPWTTIGPGTMSFPARAETGEGKLDLLIGCIKEGPAE